MQNVLCASRLSPSNFIIPLGVRTRPELRACFDRRLRAFDVDVELVESVGTSSFVSTTAIGRASCFPSARPPPTSACLGRRESALCAGVRVPTGRPPLATVTTNTIPKIFIDCDAVDEEEERLARERERLARLAQAEAEAAARRRRGRHSKIVYVTPPALKLTNEERQACPALDGTSGRDDATLQPMG